VIFKTRYASFKNHSAAVVCLASIRDDLIATGSTDGSIFIWDTSRLSLHSELRTQHFDPLKVSISQSHVAYISEGCLKLWHFSAPYSAENVFLKHTDKVECLVLSDKILVSGGKDSQVGVWNIQSKSYFMLIGHEKTVLSVAISGDTVLSGSADKTLRLWSIRTQQQKIVLDGHIAEINCTRISISGETVVSSSKDKTVRVWNKTRGYGFELCRTEGWAGEVGVTRDDKYIFCAVDETIEVWDVEARDRMCCWRKIDQEVEEWVRTYPEMRILVESCLAY
jgi:WD40 repeat protein